ncbi:hypothetical protein BG006_008820 [Podila minutissima]|uniref:Uncharacterized protein n=1 Tax=Podila minutissima TaxID=64525 RepID=A0A9P5SUC8_9FUNG|nr:hypothetical protein BG006_008820 [Podila minutissima]
MTLSPLLAYVQVTIFPRAASMEQPKEEVHQVGARAPDGLHLRLLPVSIMEEFSSVGNNNATSLEEQRVYVQQLTVGVGKFHILVLVGKSFSDPSFHEREKDLVKREVHKSYGVPTKAKDRANNAIDHDAIVIIRPDSHIGYRVEGLGKSSWADVDKYFRTTLA